VSLGRLFHRDEIDRSFFRRLDERTRPFISDEFLGVDGTLIAEQELTATLQMLDSTAPALG